MSKVAIISDIHANIHALDLFFNDISKKNIDGVICLGDLVTKYFYPKEVVNLIEKSCFIVIKGNCDDIVANDERYSFARSRLGIDGLDYLDNLKSSDKITINNIDINMFHSNKNDLEAIYNPLFDNTKIDNYKRVINDYHELFIGNKPQISLVGHTHQFYIGKVEEDKLNILKENKITVTNKDKIIVNVGSVGEHNQIKILENRKFCPVIDSFITYCIIDSNKKDSLDIEIIKIPYKKKLLEVYFDYKLFQEKGIIKNYGEETKKIEDSLISMGYDEKTLKLKR